MPQPRPEAESPADVFYNRTGAARYTSSTRIQTVQRAMTHRAVELLGLPAGHSALLLDIGCGSGISGEVLRDHGHTWVGVDLSRDMLDTAKADEPAMRQLQERKDLNHNAEENAKEDLRNVKWGLITDNDGDSDEYDSDEEDENTVQPGPSIVEVLRGDMGQGLPFRPGSFDGAVSISAVQWLCQSDCKGHVPQRRLRALFQCLYNALRRGAKAVLQFYPSNVEQVHMITNAAVMCGFNGGVVIDFPHSSKAKKHYLVLQAGQLAGGFAPPLPLGEVSADSDGEDEEYEEDDKDGGEESDEGSNDDEARTRIQVGNRQHAKRGRSHADSGASRKRHRKDNRPVTGTKDWVIMKKAERRKFGLKTTEDSKYTMRKRRPRF